MKIYLTIFLALTLLFGAAAQDTITLLGPKSNYFDNPYWFLNSGDTTVVMGTAGNWAFGYTTPDTLTVYGVAAYIGTELGASGTQFLRLYEQTDTLFDTILMVNLRVHINQLGEDLFVDLNQPPTYYMTQDLVQRVSYGNYVKNPIFPVYERYFQEPQTVSGLFYVGVYPPSGHVDGVRLYSFKRFYNTPYLPIPQITHSDSLVRPDIVFPEGWYYDSVFCDGAPFIYAILTPGPTHVSDTTFAGDTIIVRDTIINGNDTIITCDTILGIEDLGLLGRLTGVMPNPAAETAKVVSSFGMSRIEAYNMAGERVHEQRVPDGSLSATLDLRRWPAGAYILRIHTPQGIATKKLSVRR